MKEASTLVAFMLFFSRTTLDSVNRASARKCLERVQLMNLSNIEGMLESVLEPITKLSACKSAMLSFLVVEAMYYIHNM